MSYSCTSTGNSQDPSSSNKSGGVNPGTSSSSVSSSSTSHSVRGGGKSKPKPKPTSAEAMKVKKGCNTTDVGVPATTEEELLANTIITPEDVLGLQKITENNTFIFQDDIARIPQAQIVKDGSESMRHYFSTWNGHHRV